MRQLTAVSRPASPISDVTLDMTAERCRKQRLDDADVGSAFRQVGREAVAQRVQRQLADGHGPTVQCRLTVNRGKRCARHLVSTVRGRHGRRTVFLGIRTIGPVRPPVAENPQAADKSAVPPRCFLTVQRGAQPVSAFNLAHGEVGGSAVPDILFPLFAAGMVGGLLFLAFG
jgi:hypothetical protein